MPKLKVGLIYGGESFEHDVSLETAKSIRGHIDRENFEIVDIFIDKKGRLDESLLKNIDVAFLAVHGPNGEDGKLQQYLEDRGIKYTGPGVEASKLNMDKTRMHEAFKKAGLPVVEYRGFDKNNMAEINDYIQTIGLPAIIKPNNMGSSVGMTKISDLAQLPDALSMAFKCDDSIIIEKAVKNPREIEVAILGNNDLTISEPGEVLTHGQVYSYETKYQKPFKTILQAELSGDVKQEIKNIAKRAYEITGCRGYSRVDFLLDQNGKIYINEINTLPGFTSISMFPKLMAATGINYKDLITKIIELALK